jgi:hypothetical protein
MNITKVINDETTGNTRFKMKCRAKDHIQTARNAMYRQINKGKKSGQVF